MDRMINATSQMLGVAMIWIGFETMTYVTNLMWGCFFELLGFRMRCWGVEIAKIKMLACRQEAE